MEYHNFINRGFLQHFVRSFFVGNFFRKLMYGRYGYDQLNLFLLILCLICWLLSSFLKNVTVSSIFSVLGYALIFFSLLPLLLPQL